MALNTFKCIYLTPLHFKVFMKELNCCITFLQVQFLTTNHI